MRGTTPTFRYTLTDKNGDPVDLSEFTTVKVTIAQQDHYSNSKRITLHDTDISVDGNVISFGLTEAESLIFQAGFVSLQVYGKSETDSSWSTLAEDVSIRVRKSLKDGDSVERPAPPGDGSSTFQIGDETVTGTLTVDHVTYSGSGVTDYTRLTNKPALVYGDIRRELVGDISMADFGLREESVQPLDNSDIDNLVRGKF